MRLVLPALLLALLPACATSGAVRRVETQVTVLRVETARRDSVRAAELERVIGLQESLLDSLSQTQQALLAFRSATNADITEVARQLVAIQELSGQSQQRLSQLRADLEARYQSGLVAPLNPGVPGDTIGAAVTLGGPPPPSANQMFQAALMQLRRGSLGTARMGFQQYLMQWPQDAQVPDALYQIGETFATENPDSALAYYDRVLREFPTSPRAPTALYKIGRLSEERNDIPAARAAYQRLLRDYPRAADEVPLAQGRLAALRP
ncbi:MAG TPA: tetratricopeptide repeat protein [Gemmatimonadales bacterium]|nr:tetratricopeptide repeat protein [Gemmatimonadales bacterium]